MIFVVDLWVFFDFTYCPVFHFGHNRQNVLLTDLVHLAFLKQEIQLPKHFSLYNFVLYKALFKKLLTVSRLPMFHSILYRIYSIVLLFLAGSLFLKIVEGRVLSVSL